MINLFDYDLSSLEQLLISMGEKKFRATQLFTWIYLKKVYDFEQMSDISKKFIEVLKDQFCLELPKVFIKQESKDGTIKFLVELKDSHKVEAVIMPYNYGNVLCVSSQVGCNMGCSFCASGLLGKQRNLDTSEMVAQVLLANLMLEEKGKRITHVVVMGTGEPFDNYDNVLKFVRILNNPKGFEIGARHITVSTCGLPDKIRQYAHENLQINLAISLHAANNETRNKIMKINKRYPIEEVMDAVRYYEKEANRRVTFEYILIEGLNDSKKDAIELAKLIKGCLAYVNIIPYNEVKENGYKRSKRIDEFHSELTRLGVNATIRKEFGSDIDAACGQLRAKQYEKERQEK